MNPGFSLKRALTPADDESELTLNVEASAKRQKLVNLACSHNRMVDRILEGFEHQKSNQDVNDMPHLSQHEAFTNAVKLYHEQEQDSSKRKAPIFQQDSSDEERDINENSSRDKKNSHKRQVSDKAGCENANKENLLELEISSVLKYFQDNLQSQGAPAVTCPVCENIPEDPRVTQCAHVYCEECYSHLQQGAGVTDDDKEGDLKCEAEGCTANILRSLMLSFDEWSALAKIQGIPPVEPRDAWDDYWIYGCQNRDFCQSSDDDGFCDRSNRSDDYETDSQANPEEVNEEVSDIASDQEDLPDIEEKVISREELIDLQDLFTRSYDSDHVLMTQATVTLNAAITTNFADEVGENVGHEEQCADNKDSENNDDSWEEINTTNYNTVLGHNDGWEDEVDTFSADLPIRRR